MSAEEYEVNPPSVYNKNKIQQDLVQLSMRGYSLVPYQKKIRSKLYYTFHKKRIDAFFELVEAEKEVWGALKEWRMALEELKMVDLDVDTMRYEKLIERAKKEAEYNKLTKATDLDDKLGDLRKEKEMLELKYELAQLRKKIDGMSDDKDGSVEGATKTTIDKLNSVKNILLMKVTYENELKESLKAKGLSDDEVKSMIDEFDRLATQAKILPGK